MSVFTVTLEISRAKGTCHRSGRILILDKDTHHFAHVLFDLDPMNYEDRDDRRGAFTIQEIFSNVRKNDCPGWFGDLVGLVITKLFNCPNFKAEHDITHEEILLLVAQPDHDLVHQAMRSDAQKFLADPSETGNEEYHLPSSSFDYLIEDEPRIVDPVEVLEVGEYEAERVLDLIGGK